MMRYIATVGTFLTIVASPSQAAHLTATASNLQSVLNQAVGGDTVKLTGKFGVTRVSNENYTSLVTIDASSATFSDTFLLKGISNINIVGGNFGSASALTAYNKAIAIYGGTNVSVTNAKVVGAYGGQGISFTDTTNAAVTGATLSKLQAGVVFAGVVGGSISNSRSIGSVSDGFDIADGSFIDIGHNTCTGSTPTLGAHPDCVQMFSSAHAVPLSHISVHDNYASGMTQGFDNFGSTPGDSFISIVNNRVDGLMSQGIACYWCVNSTITGNTITSLDGAQYKVSMNILYGTNNIVSGNTVGTWNKAAARALVFPTRAQMMGGVGAASIQPGVVPEPAMWGLLIAGFGMIGIGQRTRRHYYSV